MVIKVKANTSVRYSKIGPSQLESLFQRIENEFHHHMIDFFPEKHSRHHRQCLLQRGIMSVLRHQLTIVPQTVFPMITVDSARLSFIISRLDDATSKYLFSKAAATVDI